MLLDDAVQPLVPRASRERGDRYFQEGRIVDFDHEGTFVGALVRGANDYDVHLDLRKNVLAVSCTCPFFDQEGQVCKHIWAVIRQTAERGVLGEVEGRIRLRRDADGGGPELAPVHDQPSGNGRRGTWKLLLESLRSRRPQISDEDRALPEQILYVVDPYGRLAQSSVRLSVLARSRKKGGDWGRARDAQIPFDRLHELAEPDRTILSLLNASAYEFARLPVPATYSIRSEAAPFYLEKAAREGRLFLRTQDDDLTEPLRWEEGPAWALRVEVAEQRSGYRIEGAFERNGTRMPLDRARLVLPGLLFTEEAVAPLEWGAAIDWVAVLARSGPVLVPSSDRDELIDLLAEAPAGTIELPETLRWVDERPEPKAIARLHTAADSIAATVAFRYGEIETAPSHGDEMWRVGTKVIRRDRAKEQAMLARLLTLPVTRDYYVDTWRLRPAFLPQVAESLLADGWEIELDEKAIRIADDFAIELTGEIDWFELRGGAKYGNQTVAMPQLLTAAERGQTFVTLADGGIGLLPRKWVEGLADVATLGEVEKGTIRFGTHQALLIDALLAARGEVATDVEFEAMRGRLEQAQPEPAKAPPTFAGSLRPYQEEGLGWLLYLRTAGLGGCLADDMGLGKTIQALALLDSVRGESQGPTLVVAPKSLLFNWKSEAAKFTPHLRVVEHHGPDRDREGETFADADLVLTTYGTLRSDIAHLRAVPFEYVILDEAQAVKNASSQSARSVRLLQARHRLALSGTPIENHLGELWSLFEFLNPGMLGPARAFARQFATKTVSPEARAALGRALRPLILRRTKEQVAPDLPARNEQTLWCELDPEQRKAYDQLRDYYREEILSQVKEKGVGGSRMQVLEALLRLRQAATHPGLINGEADAPSAKLDLLLEELAEVLESGHRALVFSQFTSLLAILGDRLKRKRMSYAYLDGQTRDRQQVVEAFQKPGGPPLFLISLKAGGVGLNLTRADYVFLLDPWWNPAVEAQAIDRAHRIGQESPVFAYRLVARDTVEERILELQASKRELAESIITEENSLLRKLEIEDLEKLLA